MISPTRAVIDVGSNSVRLLISKNGQTINKFALVTRLSLGLTNDKVLNEDSIKRTIDALSFFKNKAVKEFNVDKIYVFATAGVRYAKNRLEFVEMVKRELELDLDVISGELEAEIGALGALNGNDGGFIDLGGKSTEIVQIVSNKHVYSKSFEIGVVTLTETFGQNVDMIRRYASEFLHNNIDKSKLNTKNFVIVGGTATTLGAITLGLKEYDFRLVDNAIVTKKDIVKIVNDLAIVPVAERSKRFCIQSGREDVILSGAVFIGELLDFLEVDKFIVRDSDNLEGYLIKKEVVND